MRTKVPQDGGRSLAEMVAARIREQVIHGGFSPGQHLSEAELSDSLEVSRNTLREVFRVLTKEGLLRHEPNRGVFVATPDMATIVDLYRVRRIIQVEILEQAFSGHPAVRKMREAVERAKEAREAGDWLVVGSADLAFHGAIVALADSPRLDAFFSHVLAEMRLAFGLLSEPELLHSPFIELNEEILKLVELGKRSEAASRLEKYLVNAERVVLGAFTRH
ncbi:GntR family transcriptional regulator [uncultured Amaricoccus sp.]|uniref:GntR family transcriptional regulator n=1 Tax=uncultured Amaricoccus sp. TaxID=339341 RepID=UPI00261F220A|nr:GntR family transcriptional regulator [uncultured Amaricoccus sp.]